MCGNTTLTIPDGAADEKSAYCHCKNCIKQSGAGQSRLDCHIGKSRAYTLSSWLGSHANARVRCRSFGSHEDLHRYQD
jgi:hypothetical protein